MPYKPHKLVCACCDSALTEATKLHPLCSECFKLRRRMPSKCHGLVGSRCKAAELWKLFRDSRHCTYCRAILDPANRQIEHKIPVARGGSSEIENLTISCQECNNIKGLMTFGEFMESGVPLKKRTNRFKYLVDTTSEYHSGSARMTSRAG